MPSGRSLLFAGSSPVVVFLENVQCVTVVVLHAHGAENRSYRSCRASLFSDYFSHIGGSNPEPQDGALVPLHRFNLDGFRNIH